MYNIGSKMDLWGTLDSKDKELTEDVIDFMSLFPTFEIRVDESDRTETISVEFCYR